MSEKAADYFALQAEQIRKKLINELVKIYKKGGDPAAFAEQMLTANFTEHIIKDLGFADEMNSLFVEYDKIAGGIAKTFGQVPTVAIEQLKTLDSLFFMEHVRDVGEALTRQMVYAVYTRIDEKTLIENLMAATKSLSKEQIGTLVNTSLRTFSRATFAATAREYAPKDAKYRYVGPEDDRTRPECLEMLYAGELTLDEIEERFPGALIGANRWNCRHSWELVVE